MNYCEKCGTETERGVIFTNVSQTVHPICDGCAREHEQTAFEINEHELNRFGGAYGLVTWEYVDLKHKPLDTRAHFE